MKILAVSDTVADQLYSSDVQQNHEGVDLIIGCGDLPKYYLEFLASAFDAPLLFVRGNHDTRPRRTGFGPLKEKIQGGLDLHGQVIEHQGLLVAGIEGSRRYRPDAPYMYSEGEMRLLITRMLPRLIWTRQRYGRCLDLLVTHAPPYGIHDRRDPAHRGFKQFLIFMRLFKPRYLLHGHVHRYRRDKPRTTRFKDTTVINVYPYYLIEFELKR